MIIPLVYGLVEVFFVTLLANARGSLGHFRRAGLNSVHGLFVIRRRQAVASSTRLRRGLWLTRTASTGRRRGRPVSPREWERRPLRAWQPPVSCPSCSAPTPTPPDENRGVDPAVRNHSPRGSLTGSQQVQALWTAGSAYRAFDAWSFLTSMSYCPTAGGPW